jgi:EAL domain-containing protein (putative c-di-GMP-specific phosphodiesterase class I)
LLRSERIHFAITIIAHDKTLAEGVEKEEQLRILRLAGVSSVQGFLIPRPCPASELNFDTFLVSGVAENAA